MKKAPKEKKNQKANAKRPSETEHHKDKDLREKDLEQVRGGAGRTGVIDDGV